MKIAILTSQNQWFVRYAKELQNQLQDSKLLFEHKDIDGSFDIVFILSYHKIIEDIYLQKSKHNIVIHASDLPKGKGWAPMFWQILDGEKEIPFTMFEASSGVDDGDVYMKNKLSLTGYELNDELREKQANFTIEMCLEFLQNYEKYKTPYPQKGKESFYKKRDSKDSKLDIDKTIKEQFNLLRIVNNDEYPAFFEIDGNRYKLKIELDKVGGVELIDFVDMNLEEISMILKWRNHINIRKWMYNQNSIDLDSHLSFINSLLLDTVKQYLIVKKDENYIGVVDFTNIDYKNKECYFGLYANPFEKMAGVGRILEEVSIKYIFNMLKLNKLKLEVFKENEKAKNLYKKYGFKEINLKIVNKKEVICMELDN